MVGSPMSSLVTQIPPWFSFSDGNSLHIAGIYRDASAFLVCGGPSTNQQSLELLNQRGILSCGVNNVSSIIRTNLWVGVDPVGKFSEAIWRDPTIWKFVPKARLKETLRLRDNSGELKDAEIRAEQMPSTVGFPLRGGFRAETYLSEPGFCWGCAGDEADGQGIHGARSVMLVALKVLFVLGIRKVFLLGCDFRMTYGKKNYAFEETRSRSAVRGNNRTYRVLNERFEALVPHFEHAGLEVVNCTPGSGLTAFPFIQFEQAVDEILASFPTAAGTKGRYES